MDKELTHAIYEGLSGHLKALSNPCRLEIIEILSQGEKSVEAIVQSTGLTFANASQHLQVMKYNNIVKSRKAGHYVYYSLVSDEFLILYQHITKYALNEIAGLEKMVNRLHEDYSTMGSVSMDELERMIQEENMVLLDVRSIDEFESGHITGAISIPLDELLSRLKTIASDDEVVAYCRGPFCVLADEAVKLLTEQGYKAWKLDGSYPEWKTKHLKFQV